ncbi:MAG TPA: hemerythrin domain-containing protein [Actinomycetota bacterium]
MNASEKSLSEKHREFVPLIAAIERIEESIGEAKLVPIRLETADLHESLAHGLIPHAVGEGRTVFPVLRRVTGTSETSTEMTKEHREIARLTDELERLRKEIGAGVEPSHERELAKLLGELRHALEHHFEAEEQVCFQILKTELEPAEAREICDAMEQATEVVRRNYE